MTTKNLILKLLDGEMEISSIQGRVEDEGHTLTYDTICRNLKQMYKEGMLNRRARGNNINQNSGRRHWVYHYSKKKK